MYSTQGGLIEFQNSSFGGHRHEWRHRAHGFEPAPAAIHSRNNSARWSCDTGWEQDYAAANIGGPQCKEARRAGPGKRRSTVDDRSGQSTGRPSIHRVLRCPDYGPARGMRAQSNRRWKRYLLRKTDRRQFRGCREPIRTGEESQSETRRGSGQALGAGPDEVENASRSWLLRQDTLSARR